MTAADPRRNLIRTVQIARRELGLDDEAYRMMLERVTGQRSSTQLGVGQLGEVIAELRSLGWPGQHKRAGWRPAARKAHHRKAYALWSELKRRGIWRNPEAASLHALCTRLVAVDHVEWMSAAQSATVIAALDAMRHQQPAAAAGA